MVELVQLLALADEGVVELLDHAPAVDGVEGPVQTQAQTRRGQRFDEDVVEEREAPDEIVGRVRFRGGDDEGTPISAPAHPGFERALLGLETGRVGEDQGAALALDDALDGAQRLDLFHRDPGRDRAGYQVAGLAPDENVRHSDALKTGKG